MKLEGTYTFDAPREVVWQALLDPEVLGRVMPGGARPVRGPGDSLRYKFPGELSHAGEWQGRARFYEG